jgi:hypothetical protein
MALKTYLPHDLDLKWNLTFGLMLNGFIIAMGYTFLNVNFNHGHPALFYSALVGLSLLLMLAMLKLKVFIPLKATLAVLLAFAVTMIIMTYSYFPNVNLNASTLLDYVVYYFLGGLFILQLYIAIPLLTVLYCIALRLQTRQ